MAMKQPRLENVKRRVSDFNVISLQFTRVEGTANDVLFTNFIIFQTIKVCGSNEAG